MKPTLLINAGGGSRRMGRTKALLSVPPSNQPLLLSIVDRLRPLAAEPVLVVANDPQIEATTMDDSRIRYVVDGFPGEGPLSGLLTALPLCDGWAMVVACDIPLVDPAVFELLLEHAEAEATKDQQPDVVVPFVNGRRQPLHALYHRRSLAALEAAFAAGERSIQRVLDQVNVCTVDEDTLRSIDPQLRSFVNVNTPQEWDAIQNELRSATQPNPTGSR